MPLDSSYERPPTPGTSRTSGMRASFVSYEEVLEAEVAPRVSLALINGRMVSFDLSPPTHCFIIDPLSRWKMTWDFLMVALILYQALLIPVELAFVENMAMAEPNNWMWWIDFALGFIFTLDFGISCVTAFVKKDGSFVRNQRQILIHYALRPPFFMAMDFVSLVPFFLSIVEVSEETSSAAMSKAGKSGRFLKYARMFRMLRLLRLARAVKVIQSVSKIIILSNRYTVLMAGALKLLLGFFLCVHFGACFWRAISAFEVHAQAQQVNAADAWESYTFSVWWMVLTIGGSEPLLPTTGRERWVWSLFGFLAIVVNTVSTGYLVEVFKTFNKEHEELDHKLRVASKFIIENTVPEHVKASVLGAVRSSFQHQRDRGHFQELVDPLLSEDLRRKLYGNIYGKIMRWFPPFQEEAIPSRFLARLAVEGRVESYARGDLIVDEGLVREAMLFIVDGAAMLHSHEKRMKLSQVGPKWFFGEWALFWDPLAEDALEPHPASLTALKPCEVLAIERSPFHKAVQDFGLTAWLDHHRRRGGMLGTGCGRWGCPACGCADHWLDECETLVLADGDVEVLPELQPLRTAALQNFLSSVRNSSRRTHSRHSMPRDDALAVAHEGEEACRRPSLSSWGSSAGGRSRRFSGAVAAAAAATKASATATVAAAGGKEGATAEGAPGAAVAAMTGEGELLGRLSEEARAAREQMTAAGERLAALELAVRALAGRREGAEQAPPPAEPGAVETAKVPKADEGTLSL